MAGLGQCGETPAFPCGPSSAFRRLISGGVDTAKAVPHGRRRTGEQYADVSQLLVIAVERDARQRSQMRAMLRKDHPGARRNGGLEAELGGETELTRSR